MLDVERSILAAADKKGRQARHNHKDTAGRVQRSTEQGRRLYAIYLLAVTAGLRTVEIHRANVRDFEEKNGAAWLYIYGKGHTEADQKKALAPEVAEAIRDYLDSRTDQYTGSSPLFVSTGNRSGGKRIAVTTISTMLKKAMQEAGYNSERLTAHSLRHTAGTAVMEMTGDLYRTQQYLFTCEHRPAGRGNRPRPLRLLPRRSIASNGAKLSGQRERQPPEQSGGPARKRRKPEKTEALKRDATDKKAKKARP